MNHLSYQIATFFGAGKSKVAPGTMGSLASLFIWVPLIFWDTGWLTRALVIVAIFIIGTYATARVLPFLQGDDPKEVVIDEVVGQGIALVLCPYSWLLIVLAFVLFRLFDVLKPWPIAFIDKKIKGAFGVMLDDVLAGIFALLLLVAAENCFVT